MVGEGGHGGIDDFQFNLSGQDHNVMFLDKRIYLLKG